MILFLIQLKTKGFDKAKTRWKNYKKAYSPQGKKLFAQAGEIISEEAISQNFEAEGRPEKWDKRKYHYSWPILWKTGKMRSRLERTALDWIHQGRKHINRVYAPYYAKYHHFANIYAKEKFPVRKVIQFSQKARQKLRDLHHQIFQQRL